jgi:CubicO group peptidase (beta-lactamase class C family)
VRATRSAYTCCGVVRAWNPSIAGRAAQGRAGRRIIVVVDEGQLTTLLQEHALRHSIPGAAVGILRDGVVTTAYHGVADVRTGEPVTSETLFS